MDLRPNLNDSLDDASWWIGCEICSQRSLASYDILAVADELVFKGLVVPEMAQIARIEDRLRQLLLAQWRLRAHQAVERSMSAWLSSGNVNGLMSAVDSVMSKWADDIKNRFTQGLVDIYTLGREAGTNRAAGIIGQPLHYTIGNFTEQLGDKAKIFKVAPPRIATAFDVYDASAVTALMDEHMLWIGRHYEKNVSKTIRRSANQIVSRGLSRAEAGKLLRADVAKNLDKVVVPGGFVGSQAKYFEGLAANAATIGRVRGQIRSFQDLGVTRYILSNPMDNRTTPQCIHMNGKEFTVQNAVNQIERTAGATSPSDIKRDHPWLSMPQILAISPVAGRSTVADSGALAAAGFSLPPLHWRCRTTVDIAPGDAAFNPLTAQEKRLIVPVKPRPPLKLVKPQAKLKPIRKPTLKPKSMPAAVKPATIPPSDPLIPLKAPVKSAKPLSPAAKGINSSEYVTLENGIKGIWKSEAGESKGLRQLVGGALYKREAAAWKVDQLLGTNVVPRTVAREYAGKIGSIQEFVPNSTVFAEASAASIKAASKVSGTQLSLLDVVIGNQDRHFGNVMVSTVGGKSKFVAIDNGYSMSKRHLGRWFFNGRTASSFANKSEIQGLVEFSSMKKQLEAVDLRKLAQLLRDEGIGQKAAHKVVGRAAALRKNPSSISHAIDIEPGTGYGVGLRETTFWIDEGWEAELGANGMRELDKLMAEVYK
jgi:hypothetical protein